MTNSQKQHLLAYLGYYSAAVDGIWGQMSEQATRQFQRDFMEQEDGIFGNETEARIRQIIASEEEPKPFPPEQPVFWQEVKFFTRQEFACKCGKCGGFPQEPEQLLLKLADRTREHFKSPMLVSSGVRCPGHNAAVGGVSNSRHLTGKAMDFCVCGCSAKQVLDYLRQQPELRYAYAIDESYVHMDIA